MKNTNLLNEDYEVYSESELNYLNLSVDDLYKTKELVKLTNYQLPMWKTLAGLELERQGRYYLMTNEFIQPLVQDYILSILRKYYNNAYVRIAKNCISKEKSQGYFTKGQIIPLTWKFDKKFKNQKTFHASYSTAYKNEQIKNNEYNTFYEINSTQNPCDKFKTDFCISNYDNFEVLIEEVVVMEDVIVGKCIHATIDNIGGKLSDVCEHIDLSINIYNSSSNRFEYGLDKKIEAEKRIHFFRINDIVSIDEIPEMALNILDVKSNIYEIMYDMELEMTSNLNEEI